MCQCLNGLLERIKNSFQRERRFNADVAHELRTPLAGFQSIIEVCLSRHRKPQEYREGVTYLTLSNTGCCLTPTPVEHVFDMFWRADTARTDTGVHCGIGLSLVQKVAELLDIKVRAELEQESVFSIILELPMNQNHD